MALIRRNPQDVEPLDVFSRLDKMFDEWTRAWPFRGGFPYLPWAAEDVIRVDEFHDESDLVIRAELPGIDPDRDVELTVSRGTLHISAQRRMEEKEQDKGYTRHEIRYGEFNRALSLPEGVTEDDVKAKYADGILEIRIAVPTAEESAKPKQIPVRRG